MFELMPFENRTRNLSNYFDNLEKSFFGDFPATFKEIRTDIMDKGDRYILEAELPGFEKQDIHIDLNGDTLTVSAEHKDETEEKDKKGNYVRRERRYGSFSRSFDVSGINVDQIKAAYKNGVLELELPKQTPTQPQSRQIALE